ncbi:peptidoglycan-binding protein [Plantactinospora sp. GCM10030261]|uniref:peptidoglycan-binding protein n=1 Tax=Plantactinospora sp. GCM10030261 TaxID=3273420 RepID=UPI003620AA5E
MLVGTVAAVVAVGAGVAAAVGFGGRDPGTAAASSRPPATATVTRQTLVDSESVSGELGYGTSRAATARGQGGTVTWLAGTGSVVKRGKPLYAIDTEKVVLLYGSLPAYRTLRSGDEGTDVKQLEQNLAALGYDGFTVDDEYTDATADAVEQWQEDLGLDQTGRVEPGQIVYAAGEVRIEGHEASVGDLVQPGGSLLTYTGIARQVVVELDVDDQRLARKGGKVDLSMPDGKDVKGTISLVETVVTTPTANGGAESEPETTIEVTVTVDDPKTLAGFDKASVDVAFTASERADVLTVPVAALLVLAEGGYGLEVVEGSATRIIAVRTGLFASGRVEVSGPDVTEGMTVGIPK